MGGDYRAPVPRNVKTIVWFASGILLMSGSVMAFFGEVGNWEVLNCLQLVFITLIGVVVAIIDAPNSLVAFPVVKQKQETLAKYCAAILRVTGKGLTLTFAGSVLWNSLYSHVESSSLLSLGGICSLPVVIIGIGTFTYGMWKSFELRQVHRSLCNEGSIDAYWHQFADMEFIDKNGFRNMLNETNPSPTRKFDDHELTMIFYALSGKALAQSITKSDVDSWLRDSNWTLL